MRLTPSIHLCVHEEKWSNGERMPRESSSLFLPFFPLFPRHHRPHIPLQQPLTHALSLSHRIFKTLGVTISHIYICSSVYSSHQKSSPLPLLQEKKRTNIGKQTNKIQAVMVAYVGNI